jgi:hypothetical protein
MFLISEIVFKFSHIAVHGLNMQDDLVFAAYPVGRLKYKTLVFILACYQVLLGNAYQPSSAWRSLVKRELDGGQANEGTKAKRCLPTLLIIY